MSKRKLQKVGTCMRQILTANGHINFVTHSNVCNSKSARDALTFLFSATLSHCVVFKNEAMPGIPILICLNYSLSTIDPWQRLAHIVYTAPPARTCHKALLLHGSWQTYHMIICAHQVTCIFAHMGSCAIEWLCGLAC